MVDAVNSIPETISLADIKAPFDVSNVKSDILTKVENIREGSAANRDFINRGPASISGDVNVGPAAISETAGPSGVGQAAPENETLSQHLETLDSMSEITWRMVSFEMSNAALQKVDKSAKMFIQGN